MPWEEQEYIMNLTFDIAEPSDTLPIFQWRKKLIDDYENVEKINYQKVLCWVKKKIETRIKEYTVIFADGKKAGYYHFYKNPDERFELDDLYVLPEFQNKGIGSAVIRKCCSEVDEPVMLYVFIKNSRAVSLYKRMGFEVAKQIDDSRYIMIHGERCRETHVPEISYREERLSAAEYIDFLKRTDLGSQYPQERFEQRIKKLVKNVSISLVARNKESKIVGVLFGLTDYSYWLYVTDLGVDRDYEKQGIGKTLMHKAHQLAGGEKDIAIYLAANQNAIPFYQKLGMEVSTDVMQYNKVDWTTFTVE